MSHLKLSFMIGALLILLGLFVPSSILVEFQGATSPAKLEQLLLGSTFFKIGLVVLGLWVIVLGRMSVWKQDRPSESCLYDRDNKNHLAILAAILLSASALRLYGLDYGLWHDEIVTYVKYMRIPFREALLTYDSENQHFLFTLLAHISFRIFGESNWSLRLPAVFFGIGSIWALYLLGRQVGSTREALLSAALLAFSYHHVWFSQNARGYTGLLFWTLLSSWLFLRGIREERPQLWLFYAATAALGVYTHVTMLFVIISHFGIYLMKLFSRRKEIWPNRWAGFFLGFCLSGILTLQLYALILPQVINGIMGADSTVMVWKQPLWTLLEFVKGMQISFAASFVALAGLLILGPGLLGFVRNNPVVIQLLILPSLIGTIAVIGMGHHLWPRFFFFVVGFGALVVVRGTMVLGGNISRLLHLKSTASVSAGTALCVSLIFVSAVSVPFAYAPKQDYLGALAFVEKSKDPGDSVVTVGLATYPSKNFYAKNWKEAETLEDLNFIRSRSNRTWLIYTLPLHLQAVYPEIMSNIKQDFRVVKRFYGTLNGGTIFVCLSDTSPTLQRTTMDHL